MSFTPLKRSVIITENKFCKKCLTWKSRENFANDKNRKDGKYPECKICKNSSKIKIVTETKQCKACGVEHDELDFIALCIAVSENNHDNVAAHERLRELRNAGL